LQTEGFERDLAVSVEYNPRGYFNVRDGHHRTAFLLCRGARRIPVRMTLADRMAWAPQRKQEAVIAELERFPERLLYTPILAPLGYRRVSERDVSYPTRLDHVLRWLGSTRLVGKRLLDVGSNIGYFAQHFAREGAIVTAIEPDPEHVRLAELLSELSGVRYELRRGRFEDCELEPHDVGLMLSVFYHFARNTALRERFLSRVRTTIRETLFWESGDDPETEKRWLIEGTHLKQYEKLADTYGTGKVRELGVFWAP
jgi:SAM-dependent methyltransferase